MLSVCLLSVCALSVCALSACPAGRGEGWVVGSLSIDSCDAEKALKIDDYDLRADFYSADPLFDAAEVSGVQRSRLFIRIQETSNPVSESNSLTLQLQDMVKAAQAFIAHEVLPLTDDGLLAASNSINTAARMQLQLYTTCPSNKSPLNALGWPLVEQQRAGTARGEQCLVPVPPAPASPTPDCPTLDPAQRAELDQICAEPDFDDRQSRARIEAILGAGKEPACLYLCRLGDLQRGAPAEQANGYELDFNETIAALFVTKLVDGRAIRLGRCVQAQGRISGRFRFKMVRSRVAQPFP